MTRGLDVDSPTLRSWGELPEDLRTDLPENQILDSGWGRLIFGHTFRDPNRLREAMEQERPGERDIALYIRDPHVLLSLAPDFLFLDPSHTYRISFSEYDPTPPKVQPFDVDVLRSEDDVKALVQIYERLGMTPPRPGFVFEHRNDERFCYLVARSHRDGAVLGTVTGVDHKKVFDDPEVGSSLWCLSVDPQASIPRIGEALVRGLIEHFRTLGRNFLDLSVLHDNRPAIGLYERLGFRRVPVFCVKTKNAINQPLYVARDVESQLNPYGQIITREARKRGIGVEIVDAEASVFRLSHGGRSILCRESLTELASAVAMSMCEDKRVASRLLGRQGIRVAEQQPTASDEENTAFLRRHGRIVVKPAQGEQGRNVFVDISTESELERALTAIRGSGEESVLEAFIEGHDLRLVVIGDEVVASALRHPPSVVGTGRHSIRDLIEKQNRRRRAQTGGESFIPLDSETNRVLASEGYELHDILPAEHSVVVRKTANLHTGGIIEDVTERVHPELLDVAVRAAHTLGLPVAGIDLIVPDVASPEYALIEANERPGLANHEPQPTAQKFVDLLFPQTIGFERG
jgi:GNAT-family acetyltransferase (TIGR03103 family)